PASSATSTSPAPLACSTAPSPSTAPTPSSSSACPPAAAASRSIVEQVVQALDSLSKVTASAGATEWLLAPAVAQCWRIRRFAGREHRGSCGPVVARARRRDRFQGTDKETQMSERKSVILSVMMLTALVVPGCAADDGAQAPPDDDGGPVDQELTPSQQP